MHLKKDKTGKTKEGENNPLVKENRFFDQVDNH